MQDREAVRVRVTGDWPAFFGVLASLVLATVVTACGEPGRNNETPDPRADRAYVVAAAAVAIMVRGQIHPAGLALEPVFQTDSEPSEPVAEAGPHRVRGLDDEGTVLFDLRFAGTPVADVPRGTEEHFNIVIPLAAAGPLRLNRIELRAGDGRELVRNARLSARELVEAVAAEGTLTAESVATDRVRVRWDSDLFPMVVVRDPETRRILAFGRGGETTVAADLVTVEIIVSEGVRSAARTVEVR